MIKEIKSKKFILFLIILLAFVLRIYWLDRVDMQGDEATYSFRAIGYLDYLGSEQQTTPIQWFGNVPWWSKLSFHDAPPLIFLIQFIFFKIFGVSTFTARLPFVLFGTATVYLIYLLARKLFNNEIIGLLSSFILAILNYHIWASRTGYLEGILTFFIVLAIYFFLKLLEQSKLINYLLVGLSLGLAFMCKYTMIFLLPAIFCYFLIFNRKILFNKKILITILTFLIIISPVIFYNLMVYQTRGHLDLQFSQLLGMDLSKDWSLFTKGHQEGRNLWENFQSIIGTLNSALGRIYFYLFIASLIFFVGHLFKKDNQEQNKKIYIWLFCLFFLIIQFIFIGAGPRFLPVFTPLVALTIGSFIFYIFTLFKKRIYQYLFLIILTIFSGYSIWEDINTHLILITHPPFNSSLRGENYGFRQLEEYLANQKIDFSQSVVIYDGRLNWFARTWYFFRQVNYLNQHYLSIEYFIKTINEKGEDYFKQVKNYQNYYFIKAENTSLDTTIESNGAQMFEEFLVKDYNLKPVLIYRDDGQVAFEVYNFH